MDSVKRLWTELNSDEARARRQARRALREKHIYAQLKEAVTEVNGNFEQRHAYLWAYDTDRGASRKIQGHAGACATMYVSETFGDFDIQGTLRTRFAGMNREAGFGGHGITEGTIMVDVEITPIRGISQLVEVPVYVKDGHMLQPGLMYHQGTPYVIAQSSINEVLEAAYYGNEVKTDRKSLFSPPKTAANRQKDIAPSRNEYAYSEKEKQKREQDEAKASERFKQRNKERRNKERDQEHNQEHSSQHLISAGAMARLACDVTVPISHDFAHHLLEGSRVFVMQAVESTETLVHIKHESGVEAFVERALLA